jgi:hypothetical protein
MGLNPFSGKKGKMGLGFYPFILFNTNWCATKDAMEKIMVIFSPL